MRAACVVVVTVGLLMPLATPAVAAEATKPTRSSSTGARRVCDLAVVMT